MRIIKNETQNFIDVRKKKKRAACPHGGISPESQETS